MPLPACAAALPGLRGRTWLTIASEPWWAREVGKRTSLTVTAVIFPRPIAARKLQQALEEVAAVELGPSPAPPAPPESFNADWCAGDPRWSRPTNGWKGKEAEQTRTEGAGLEKGRAPKLTSHALGLPPCPTERATLPLESLAHLKV